jgi:hypothetical protein
MIEKGCYRPVPVPSYRPAYLTNSLVQSLSWIVDIHLLKKKYGRERKTQMIIFLIKSFILSTKQL